VACSGVNFTFYLKLWYPRCVR